MTAKANAAPARTILFTSYYDATASTKEQDYGNFSAIVTEDFYFSSSLRAVALGRLRREVRNNPYLAGLVNKFPEAVGYSVLRSRTVDRGYNTQLERLAKQIARRVTADADSLRTLEGILKTELLVAGELFLVERVDGAVQVIPSEFCGSPSGAVSTVDPVTGRREVNGIIYDAANQRVAYRFGRLNPGGVLTYTATEVVEARFVLHVFHKDRVQMGRGLPWLLPSLRTARDLYEITRSKTKQIKDANSISGFLEKANAAEVLKGLDAPAEKTDGTAETEKPSDPADKVKDGPIVVELKPGTFIALEPGEKVHSLMSAYNAQDYKELVMLMLHAISSPVGLPVELWFSGLGDVNYSGYKGLGVQWNGRRQDIIDFLTSSFYEPFYSWRLGKAIAEGDLPPVPAGAELADVIEVVFRRTPILDDEKAGKANKIKLESGETDLAEIWAEAGYSEEEVFARRRQLWLKLQIAAGELAEGGDHTKEKVPPVFLLRGLLPGELPIATGKTNPAVDPLTDPATTEAADAADAATAAADTAKEAATEAAAALARIETLVARITKVAA